MKPTATMAREAAEGLRLRKQYGRGGTSVGVARARQLVSRQNLSDSTIKRMHSFFSRHAMNLDAPKNRDPSAPGYPGAGLIAWKLWGGDAGRDWARRMTMKRNAGTTYRVVHLDYGEPAHDEHVFADLARAEKLRRAYTRRGMTAWVETTDGDFVPVKGFMRPLKPQYLIGKGEIWALRQVFGGRTRVPNRLEPTSLPHIRRCLKAGLVTVDGSELVLTSAGVAAIGQDQPKRNSKEKAMKRKAAKKTGIKASGKTRNPSGMKVRVERDSMGSVTLTPVSKAVQAKVKRLLRRWEGTDADPSVYLQDWQGDEWLDGNLSEEDASHVRSGYSVTITMDPWEWGTMRGWDIADALQMRKTGRNPDYAHATHRAAADHRHATGGWGRNPKRYNGPSPDIARAIDKIRSENMSKRRPKPKFFQVFDTRDKTAFWVAREKFLKENRDAPEHAALAAMRRGDKMTMGGGLRITATDVDMKRPTNPKKKGKKMAKKTTKKKTTKGRPFAIGSAYYSGTSPVAMARTSAALEEARKAKKSTKKKAKKKTAKRVVKRGAKKKTAKRVVKRGAKKKTAKRLTAAQKLAKKRAAAARKAKRTRMAVKASACKVGQKGRIAQGRKPGRCPPKPKIKRGKIGAPLALRMHRSQGHKTKQKYSEAVRNFYNLKEPLE